MNRRGSDVVVIGGGVIGCATAWALARRGLSVTVVEEGTPGRGATWAAGGMLSPLGESGDAGPFLALALASLDRYEGFIAGIAEATGLTVEYQRNGKLEVAFDPDEERDLAAAFAWRREAGHAVDWVDADAVRRIEPRLSDAVRAGVYTDRDHQVDNRQLGRALWLAAAQAGVRFRLGDAAVAVEAAADAVRGVRLAGGDFLPTGRVVVAAGCWSGRLNGLPHRLPISPVRGQMVAVDAVPRLLARVVGTRRCYLVPRATGRILIGATVERAGFACHTTPEGIGSLLAGALEAVPGLAAAPIAETWAGLRPGTPDDLPILGPDPAIDGLLYATGHYRNGILLAPITADLITGAITGEPAAVPLEAFAVDRFSPVVVR